LVIHTAQAGRRRYNGTPPPHQTAGRRRHIPPEKENSCQRPFYIGTHPSPKLKKLTNGVN
jgi:hypothetical protein